MEMSRCSVRLSKPFFCRELGLQSPKAANLAPYRKAVFPFVRLERQGALANAVTGEPKRVTSLVKGVLQTRFILWLSRNPCSDYRLSTWSLMRANEYLREACLRVLQEGKRRSYSRKHRNDRKRTHCFMSRLAGGNHFLARLYRAHVSQHQEHRKPCSRRYVYHQSRTSGQEAVMEYAISDKVRAWAKAENYDCEMYLDLFNDYLANRRQKPYKDLDAAYRQCVRCDWGNLRRNKQLMQPRTFTQPETYRAERKPVHNKIWVPPQDGNDVGHWIQAND